MAKPQPSSPLTDLLEGNSFVQLAAALRARAGDILEIWEELVRDTLPSADHFTLAQLRDHIPQTLAKLADALGSSAGSETQQLIAQTAGHGIERFHQGYNVKELVIEYRLLRRVVIEQVEDALGRRTSTIEDVALSMGIDAVLQQGVEAFVGHLKERLQSAAQAESKYLAFLSHDLRGSLNAIALQLEVIRYGLADASNVPPELTADLAAGQRSIRETMAGMDRLLQAERLRHDTAEPKITAVDLYDLTTGVARQFAQQAEQKGLRIVVDVRHGQVVQSDREWLALILQNLIGNSIKYSSRGTIRVSSDGSTLSVSDEGPGIAPGQVDRIFQAFERGETHGQAGIGLGLAIAAQAARLLGAHLSVESKIGVGSTFCLQLPQSSSSSRD